MQACTFDGNRAQYGGAVANYKGTVEMHACTFDGNRAERCGGAVVDNKAQRRCTRAPSTAIAPSNGGGAVLN